MTTEGNNPKTRGISSKRTEDIVRIINEEDFQAFEAVKASVIEIAKAAITSAYGSVKTVDLAIFTDSRKACVVFRSEETRVGTILKVPVLGEDKIIGITDSIAATLMPDGVYGLGSLSVTLKGGRCTVTGTDVIAGSVLTMDSAYRNFIDQGYSILQTVKFLSTIQSTIWLH